MEWFKFDTALARRPEFIGCEPNGRAAWLCVLAYCVEQENGGRITGGALWKDRQWQQACGVMRAEIEKASPLLEIVGDDIEVMFYPEHDAKIVKKRRAASRKGAHARWHKDGMPYGIPSGMPYGNAEKRRGDKSRAEEKDIVAFCVSLGLPASDGTSMFYKWEENGWMNGKKPIRDWQLTIRRWHSSKWLPSQQGRGGKAPQVASPAMTEEERQRRLGPTPVEKLADEFFQ